MSIITDLVRRLVPGHDADAAICLECDRYKQWSCDAQHMQVYRWVTRSGCKCERVSYGPWIGVGRACPAGGGGRPPQHQ